jgi:8-oxo-dGTP pyrophosphatase MutT (NUDIX family)
MKKKDKLIRKAKKAGVLQQVAALPYRYREDGLVDFLVITSRRTARLIVPKGWPMKGKSDCRAAAIEAHQEAGVRGQVGNQPIGQFSYFKDLDNIEVPVVASVFLLKVKRVKSRWKEAASRRREWMSASDAAAALSDRELAALVEQAGAMLGKPAIGNQVN